MPVVESGKRMRTRQTKATLELIFDVETTGLPPGGVSRFCEKTAKREYEALARSFREMELYPHMYKNVREALDQYPFITQLSWVLIETRPGRTSIIESSND